MQGHWIAAPSEYSETRFWGIHFKEDKVELMGDDWFKEVGTYQVENGQIRIQLERDDLVIETEVQSLEADTLQISDGLTYHRHRDITSVDVEAYELIGIPTKQFLSEEKGLLYLIHFYKSDGNIQIRCGDKMATLEDLPLFLERRHSRSRVLVFVGKGIRLKDLKSLYYRLASIGQLNVYLGTKREGLFNTHIFKDKIDIWWEDLENHVANLKMKQPLPPPPPMAFRSKEKYLQKGGRVVKIASGKDLQKIEELTEKERTVISISSNLPVEDYVELKKRLAEKERSDWAIITEIE